MATLTLKAIDDQSQPLPGATFDVVFRGKTLGGLISWNTGTASKKADNKGEAVIAIPLFTDHVNIVTTSGSNIGESTVKVNPTEDWMFWLNPTAAFVSSAIATSIPVDITPGIAGGKKELVQPTEFDPVRVATYKTTTTLKKVTDWIMANLITIVVILIIIAVAIYSLKYISKPLSKVFQLGKNAVSKTVEVAKDVVKY